MTTLYRTVLIESAEQAEALPIGTIAILDDETLPVALHVTRTAEHLMPWRNGKHVGTAENVVGAQALVPIEAEEEVVVDTADLNLDPEHEYWSDDPNLLDAVRDAPKRTRLVTTWTPAEEA